MLSRKPYPGVMHCCILVLAAMAAGIGCKSDGASSGSGDSVLAPLMDQFSPPTPSQAARDAFNMYDADKRRRSVHLLAASPFGGEEPYLRTYRLLADDPDPTVRAACAKALGLHGTVHDALILKSFLNDQDLYVRWEAAKSLQRIHNDVAVDGLRQAAVSDQDADVRMAAAAALGQYPSPAVFDTLVAALNDQDYGVVQASRESLKTLTGHDAGLEPNDWLAWAQENRRDLFGEQQDYTYKPWAKPRGILDRMQFWSAPEKPAPKAPAGLSVSDDPQAEAEGARGG